MAVRVAVVGAGVVGLFTALELIEAGAEVTVYERGRPGSGITSRNANVVHVIQLPFKSLKSRLALEGNRLHWIYSRLLGYQLRPLRAVLAATGPHARLVAWLAWRLLKRRLPAWASPRLARWREAVEVEPLLHERVAWSVVVDGYGVVDPGDLVARLARAVEEYGGAVEEETPVKGLRREPGGGVTVETPAGLRRFDYAVNAAGPWAHEVAATAGDSYRVTYAKGVMTIHPKPRLQAILARIQVNPRPKTKGGGAIPQASGELLLGPTYSGNAELSDESYSEGDVEALHSKFQPLLAVPIPPPARVVVGHRPLAARRDFVVERRGPIIHFIGIESPGLTAAPALARMAARLLGLRAETRPANP